MTELVAQADTENQTVTYGGTTYRIQTLGDDSFTVLREGVPVGRIVYTFGSAQGVPEGSEVSEETLTLIGEAWFAAIDQ